jgi:hypothetical protein
VNRSVLLLKLAAVASSVLLLAGFVWYRTGALRGLMERGGRPFHSASSPTLDDNEREIPRSEDMSPERRADDAAAPRITGVRIIMSGSKMTFLPMTEDEPPSAPEPSDGSPQP